MGGATFRSSSGFETQLRNVSWSDLYDKFSRLLYYRLFFSYIQIGRPPSSTFRNQMVTGLNHILEAARRA